MPEQEYAVRMRGITKRYDGKKGRANNNISLDLFRGEILCLAGENGAGKSTLMKILYGLEDPTEGEIEVKGRVRRIDSPLAANRLGIGMVHQHFMLFPEYTVAENVVMGIEPRCGGFLYDTKAAVQRAGAALRAQGCSVRAEQRVGDLTVGEMQQVEICKMLYRDTDIIILDEPTAVLTEQETAALFTTLRNLSGRGASLILITHKIGEILRVSHRVAVLRKGELAGIRITAETDGREISRLMTGAAGDAVQAAGRPAADGLAVPAAGTGSAGGTVRAAAPLPEPRGNGGCRPGSGPPVLAFEEVTVIRRGQRRPLLDHLSFALGAGEILGFTGTGGNGLGVLEAVLGGFLHPASGRVLHHGRDISRLNIRRLRRQGLSYVPADRLRVGCALEARVDENLILDRRKELVRGGIFNHRAVRAFCGELAGRYGIDGGLSDSAASLSGGNLQKLILAREIDQFRDYIVFSEPARGLDIQAGAYVYGEMAKLRALGAAVILISANLDEILSNADRIIVLYRGAAAAEFRNIDRAADTIREEIGAYMLGLKRREAAVHGAAVPDASGATAALNAGEAAVAPDAIREVSALHTAEEAAGGKGGLR
ncbi:MAG: ATP-binding cassette domain-containing protein [Treponema sp.]|jgi:simple sugar transport system ATP-binding protein|nr:ATP-binding cassette domain-containing protein [Treponema sp.]